MIRQLISSAFTRVSAMSFNFIILLITARWLGSSVLGQVSQLVLNIAVVQTINEIYSGAALMYFIPSTPLRKIYSQGIVFIVSCTLLASPIMLFFSSSLPVHWTYLALLVLTITFTAFNNQVLLGRENIRSYNTVVLVQPLLLLVFLSLHVFVMRQCSFESWLHSFTLSYAATFLLSVVLILKLNWTSGEGRPGLMQVLQKGIINQIGNLAHTLSNRLNYYLLAASPAVLGVYTGSTSFVEGFWVISAGMSPIILSYVANQRGSHQLAVKTLAVSKLCVVLVCLVVIILWLIPTGFFTFLLGSDFSETKQVMLRLSPGVILISFSSIISHYFSGLGKQKVLLWANLAGLLIAVITAWPFIKAYGLYGACYSASMAYAVQAIVVTAIFAKTNRIKPRELFEPKIDFTLLKKSNEPG